MTRSRLFPHPWLSLFLGLVWLLLAQEFSSNSLAMAAILATLIPHFTARYWPERAGTRARPLALASYAALVLRDIVTANIAVARIILFMRPGDIRPAFIAVPIDLSSPGAITILACTITLTPGTVTADIAADRRTLLVHALHAPDPDAVRREIKTRYEARLKAIFA